MLKDFHIAGLLRTCLWLDRVAAVEVLTLGKSALSKYDCTAEIVGGWIWISAGGMDEADEPYPLFSVGDTPENWVVVRRFCLALLRSAVRSLRERPLHIGADTGPDAWLIA